MISVLDLIGLMLRAAWWLLGLCGQVAWALMQVLWVLFTAAGALSRVLIAWVWRQGARIREEYRHRRRLGPVVATTATGTPLHVIGGRKGA